MPYVLKIRGMGDGLSTYGVLFAVPTGGLSLVPSAAAYAAEKASFDPLGALASGIKNAENWLYDAATGDLTKSQNQVIANQRNADIAKAGAGNAELIAYEQALGNREQSAVTASGFNSGPSNILADLGIDPNAPAGAGSTGIAEWVQDNYLLIFALAGAFLIFRPDKALRRR